MPSGYKKDGSFAGKVFKKGCVPWSKLHPELMPSGEKHHNWKDGKTKNIQGYIEILQPSHPRANNRGYVYEHRLVAEKYLGRHLTKKEVVHHINEVKNDNRIENFIIFKSKGYHRLFHRWGYYNPKYIVFDGRKLLKLSS